MAFNHPIFRPGLILALAAVIASFANHMIWSQFATPLLVADLVASQLQFTLPTHLEGTAARLDARKSKISLLQNPPSEMYILGERNSGTNYLARVLNGSFVPSARADSLRRHEAFSSEIPVLKHKHMFRHSLLSEEELREISFRTDILWILAVRSPCDWAEAMKRLPWHVCCPNNINSECPGAAFIGFEHRDTLKNHSLADFFQMEWGDWPESTNFRNLSFVGKDFTYPNIFALRRHKLLLMKQIIDAVPRNVSYLW